MDLCVSNLKALGAFDYVAANKLITRPIRIYPPLNPIFFRLIACETLYTQLSFMKPKWFTRKDTLLNSQYAHLADEISREIAIIDANPTSTQSQAAVTLLLQSLCEFCRCRQLLITIYHSLATQTTHSVTETMIQELVFLGSLCTESSLPKHLDILGLGVEKEINILLSLLKARTAIINYAFQDACISLFVCKQDINDWKTICEEQDFLEKSQINCEQSRDASSTWRLSLFGNTSEGKQKQGHVWPQNLRWQTRYLDNLAAKMTLYFSTILVSKENVFTEDEPEKALWKGLQVDYHDQICTFRRRFNALSISLVYEVTSTPFHPKGYVCAGTPYEPPQGVHSFPFIYCHPKQPPKDHLPNIISIIQGCRHKLGDPKGSPVYFFDNRISSTYYFMRVDEHVVLVIIYLDKHPHREPTTSDFMTSLVTSLRGSSVIGELVRMD
ncbi:hypothetical protein CLU79DRAFT_753503 [Phycomyces nitens]|nr:hypothetical protein CLU79DRAFT_753503 [Phycomyces nitens]